MTLASLGITYSRSAPGQLQAAVPEAVFRRYLAAAKRAGREITAQRAVAITKEWHGGPVRRLAWGLIAPGSTRKRILN